MTLNGQPVHTASNNHCEQHEQQHCGTNPRTHRVGKDMQPDCGASDVSGMLLCCVITAHPGPVSRLASSAVARNSVYNCYVLLQTTIQAENVRYEVGN